MISLALGIGANTAIVQLIDAVRFRVLPVDSPRELAIVRVTNQAYVLGNFGGRHADLTYPQWEQLRASQQAFSALVAWSSANFDLASRGESRFAENALWVSGNFFDALGVRPALGRLFSPADDVKGCGSPGVVLSHAFWRREFTGDRTVVGRAVMINGHPLDVIGVTAPGFFGVEVGRSFDLAVPLCADALINGERSRLEDRSAWWLAVMGRRKPEWSVVQSNAHVLALSPALFRDTLPVGVSADAAAAYLGFTLGVEAGASGYSRLRLEYDTPLVFLLGVAGIVLLIACANLANLLLARASVRETRDGGAARDWRIARPAHAPAPDREPAHRCSWRRHRREGNARFNRVSAGYFATMRTTLVEARDFDERDTPGSPTVAVVNESFSTRFVGRASPLGATFRLEGPGGTPAVVVQIVGLVRDSKYGSLREEFGPIVYLAASRVERPGTFDQILIRSSAPLAGLMRSVSQALDGAHVRISFHFHDFQEQVRYSLLRDRLMATLCGFFAALAVLLSTIGVYGVMSYSVVQRTNEIGIRLALGAPRHTILLLVLREAAAVVGFGVCAGIMLAWISTKAARDLLYELEPSDPATLAAGVLVLAAAAAAASYLPRASGSTHGSADRAAV